ncbi:MAG TPA: hypothetical protein PK826_15480 [Anaerolineae bacterium]|nr:hypothetical protein [Anaerolineae bacterium]
MQMGGLQPALEVGVGPGGPFGVDQQAEPIFEGQVGVLGTDKLVGQGGAQAVEPKMIQLVHERLDEHGGGLLHL